MTFCREPNTAYFTNVSFVKEDAQSYKYNSDGELVSVTSSDNAEQSFSYSGADLISQVTKGNGSFSYEYDDAHNVTSVTNDGVSMSVSYDGKGNTTGTVLTGDGTSQKISSSAGYDSTGNRVTSQTDARGKTVSYSYDNVMDKQTGQPSSITDANNNTVFNFYNNSNGRITNTSLGYDVHLDYVYSGGQLASMSRGGYIPGNTTEQTQVYTMSYNGFGNMTGVSVGSRNLASYTYGSANGLMTEMSYGNGASVSYEYDELERVSEIYYNGSSNAAVSYTYSNNGSVSKIEDHAANRVNDYNLCQHNHIGSGVSNSISVIIEASFFLHLLDGHSITQNGRWIPEKADYREIYQKMPKRIDRWRLVRLLKKRARMLKKNP